MRCQEGDFHHFLKTGLCFFSKSKTYFHSTKQSESDPTWNCFTWKLSQSFMKYPICMFCLASHCLKSARLDTKINVLCNCLFTTASLPCCFASEYRISDPKSAERNFVNETVGELPISSGANYISHQVILSCKLLLDYWNPFNVMIAAWFFCTENLITLVSWEFSQILPLNIYQ